MACLHCTSLVTTATNEGSCSSILTTAACRNSTGDQISFKLSAACAPLRPVAITHCTMQLSAADLSSSNWATAGCCSRGAWSRALSEPSSTNGSGSIDSQVATSAIAGSRPEPASLSSLSCKQRTTSTSSPAAWQ